MKRLLAIILLIALDLACDPGSSGGSNDDDDTIEPNDDDTGLPSDDDDTTPECDPPLILLNGECVRECDDGVTVPEEEACPLTCPPGEEVVDKNCQPITCEPPLLLIDDQCQPDPCDEDEVWEDGECNDLECGFGQIGMNHDCLADPTCHEEPIQSLPIAINLTSECIELELSQPIHMIVDDADGMRRLGAVTQPWHWINGELSLDEISFGPALDSCHNLAQGIVLGYCPFVGPCVDDLLAYVSLDGAQLSGMFQTGDFSGPDGEWVPDCTIEITPAPCPFGYELVDDTCTLLCPENLEPVGDECREPCDEGQARNVNGNCVDLCDEPLVWRDGGCHCDPPNAMIDKTCVYAPCDTLECAEDQTCIEGQGCVGYCDLSPCTADQTCYVQTQTPVCLNDGALDPRDFSDFIWLVENYQYGAFTVPNQQMREAIVLRAELSPGTIPPIFMRLGAFDPEALTALPAIATATLRLEPIVPDVLYRAFATGVHPELGVDVGGRFSLSENPSIPLIELGRLPIPYVYDTHGERVYFHDVRLIDLTWQPATQSWQAGALEMYFRNEDVDYIAPGSDLCSDFGSGVCDSRDWVLLRFKDLLLEPWSDPEAFGFPAEYCGDGIRNNGEECDLESPNCTIDCTWLPYVLDRVRIWLAPGYSEDDMIWFSELFKIPYEPTSNPTVFELLVPERRTLQQVIDLCEFYPFCAAAETIYLPPPTD